MSDVYCRHSPAKMGYMPQEAHNFYWGDDLTLAQNLFRD